MTKPSAKLWRPFRFLSEAWVWGLFVPNRRGIAVLLAGIPLVALGFAVGLDWLLFWSFNGAYVLLSLWDLAFLPAKRQIRVSRAVPERVELQQPFGVTLAIELPPGSGNIRLQAADDLPLEFKLPPPVDAEIAGGVHEFRYETVAYARGSYPLSYIYLRYSRGLGLWSRQVRLEAPQELRVFPDLTGARGILASMRNSLILDGKRVARKESTGTEFHYIREYTPDDDPRAINWTATARSAKPMSNVYQAEKGKILTLMIDCGRLMGIELDGRTKLDRALEAALSLAAVALKQGEMVSLLAFAGDVKVYVPPARRPAHLQQLLEAVYDLRSEAAESNYSRAFEHLLYVERKRSMIVLFSDMENYLFEDELAPYLLKLRRTRSLMLLSLEDPVLTAWCGTEPTSLHKAYIRSTAQSQMLERRQFTGAMAAAGISVLDVPAGQLALAAVNRYLELRGRERA